MTALYDEGGRFPNSVPVVVRDGERILTSEECQAAWDLWRRQRLDEDDA